MSLRTTILTSAFATAVAVVSCGGGNHKKGQAVPPDDAGSAGEQQPPEEVAGGGAGGEAGSSAPVESAGEGGSAPTETAGEGGEGGQIVQPELLEVLFTVSAKSKGLAGTSVSTVEHPASIIFGASSPTPEAVNGTNQVVITAAQLGIADTDELDAFTVSRPLVTSPSYLFSISDQENEQGARPTRLNRSSVEDGVPGDVYSSEAITSFRWLGEGGDALGDNELIADEQSLGLASAPLNQGIARDDLTGVLPLLGGTVPTEIYFSVSKGSAGLPNTAVAASAPGERGCTIFKSSLDGKNSAAYSCADLGLTSGADVKGLSLLVGADSQKVLFTVDSASGGVVESGVGSSDYKANNVYSSPADGSNAIEVPGVNLGLDHYDQIDALSVIEPTAPDYSESSNCQLTPSPLDSEGAGLTVFRSARGLGKNLLLVAGDATGPGDTTITSVGAYDPNTCAFVARADLPLDALQSHAWVAIPLPGWSAAKPLQNLEYWEIGSINEGQDMRLYRESATGTVLNSYSFGTIPDLDGFGYSGWELEFDAANNHLVGVLAPNGGFRGYRRIVLPRPASTVPDGSTLEVASVPLPHPCAYQPRFGAIDEQGISYFAQLDNFSYSTFRVCPLTPSGEFNDFPYSVTIGTSSAPSFGMLVPNQAVYGLYEFNGFTLVRQSLR